MTRKIQLGVSACLLGQPVRYDGAHQAHAYILAELAAHYALQPICPEVSIGLGVPRPPIRLQGSLTHPQAVGKDAPSINPSAALRALGRDIARACPDLGGFIVKSRSPSCALGSAKVQVGGVQIRQGVGLFTEQLRRYTHYPIIEETGLDDPVTRANFLRDVLRYHHAHCCAAGETEHVE